MSLRLHKHKSNKQTNKMVSRIEFYSTRPKQIGFMSNFTKVQNLWLDSKPFPTTEHYFQSAKFAATCPEHAERIRTAKTATVAARLGRSRKYPIRPDWAEKRDEVMETALMAKFSQNRDMRRLLIGTGQAELVEHTSKDRYWADGGDGSGQNRLGQLLMRVRERVLAMQQIGFQIVARDLVSAESNRPSKRRRLL